MRKVYGGIDGCRSGWFSVFIDEQNCWSAKLYPNLFSLWSERSDSSLLLIDIPVGIVGCRGKQRSCDVLARKMLGGKRASAVFNVPCRKALYCSDYTDANRINKKYTGKGLSKQSWNIVPKIREADNFLQTAKAAREVLRESHPELCFKKLAKRDLVHNKKTEAGHIERMDILSALYHDSHEIVEYAAESYRGKLFLDDILDSMVLALTAFLENKNIRSVPENRETDEYGLKMEIVYPE
ncbi:hypothetical protein CHISP_0961 [Chitinispirillum alkaliphilum]|nr:hypothetical protein CHISP_0961 [Chitinispirillum alkaliphilum]